ncbi:Putative protein in type-1 retrotransposable element R1DM [Araneus ventricosus]|uniref:Endonuclease/exonuclease/phosphatase domain-containing protein n=1 Tax=Araneus ventricosus TaxID=182803 RepID=A0A4Y2HZZ2_ARAVE|nr:Putative protein in type-1 retrotransposable element R1DM [Araneus ventricosus]
MGFNTIRGIQISVNRCKATHSGVFQVARDLELDFIAIQDPYLVNGEPPISNFGCKTFASRDKRADTYILNKNLNVFYKFNTTHTVAVELHFNNMLFNIFNCYFPPHDNTEDLIEELRDFNFYNSFSLLVGDFNCKSRSWGYDSDNFRGRKMTEFIAASNLHICNITEYGSTFQSTTNVGFPDLTLLSLPVKGFYTNDVIEISRPCSKRCPQGSVISLTIWNIYINSILINDRPDLHIQAFADDLALLIEGRTARELKSKTNLILAVISNKLEGLQLKLSIEKCQAVVYRSIASQKFSKRNSTVLKRKPTIKIKNHSIKVSDSLKILGITIGNKLSWTAHFSTLHAKALTSNFNRVVKSNWNMNKNLLKIWYYTVIEKALLYGASVWGGVLTKNQIDRLHSIQRIFLLKFIRAFRTPSTNVLKVLTGIPPLHIVAKAEFIKFRIWVNRSNEYNTIFDINLLDKCMPFKNIPSRQKLINLNSNIPNADYEIYKDGSRIENETGFAACILRDEINIQNHLFKLNTFNSVFQAELAAIEFAVNWAVKEKVKVNIQPLFDICHY